MSDQFARRGQLMLALGVFVFSLIASGSLPVLAINEVPQNAMYEIKLPVISPVSGADAVQNKSGRQPADVLSARYGGVWNVHSHNSQTGTPHFVYGSGAKLAAAVSDAADVERLAKQVLGDNQDVLGADLANLKLSSIPHGKGKWVAHYQQTYHGLDVWLGRALVAFSDDGRLLLMGSDYYNDIDLDPTPRISQGTAVQIATDDVPFYPATDRVEGEVDLLVLPVPQSISEVEHHLVYRIRVRTADPLGIWVTHVDAHTGDIVWRYNDIHFDYHGDTSSLVQKNTYCNGAFPEPMPYLRLTVNGVGQVITDSAGDWAIAGTGGDRSVTGDLYGPYCDMNNNGGGEALYSGTAQENVNHTVEFDNSNSQQDERDVFDAVNSLHDFFQLIAPEFNYPHQRISAYVSRTDGYCPGNAWWDGTINFCSAGSGYANTGEIQDVVFHEFGHGVQDAILGFQGNEGLGEGNSDILDNLMTQVSIIGLGFYQGNCTSGIRDADNNLVYPDDVSGQSVHNAGRVIAGFNWDAMVGLQAVHGQEQGRLIAASNWHYGRVLLQPTNQPDQVFATFFADDDDGNLDNGTPNHSFYCQAAENHNFECPAILVGVLFSHQPLQDTLDSVNPYVVQSTIFSTEAALDPSTIKLVWRRAGGTFSEVLMTDLGGDLYEAQIPAQSPGAIDYYLYAEDTVGNTGTYPDLAPDQFVTFLVASEIDPVEVPSGWTVGGPGDDATSGVWERVDPVATSAQPEDDHTADGVYCWITGQHPAGGSPGANDVDGGKTTLISPVYDLSTYDEVIVRYWKWYSNDQGNAPNADDWVVEVSNDGGSNWTSLENTGNSTNAWVPFTFNMADYFPSPGQLQLRFVASDEGTGSLVEAGIDDFVLAATSTLSAVGDEGLAVRLVTDLDQNVPNPFNPATEISFSLSKAGPVALKVFDLQGRLVTTLIDEVREAGPNQVIWDGTNLDGGTVASGVYFYRLETEDETLNKRMLLVK